MIFWLGTWRLPRVNYKITSCLLNSIFDGNDLEFTLTTEEIQCLVDTYNQLNPSEYPGFLSSALGSLGIETTAKLFDDLVKSIANRDRLKQFIERAAKALMTSNFEDENLLEREEDVRTLESILNIISLASESKTQVLDCLRVKNSLRDQGFEKGVGELVSLSLDTGISPKKLLDAAIAGIQSSDLDLENCISTLSGESIESLRRSFIELDETFICECSKALSHQQVAKTEDCLLPGNDTGSPKSFTEAPLLLHEMKKQRRHLPTRLLVDRH